MLARYYDLMQDVDYGALAGHLLALLRRHGHTPRQALDLACGTGSLCAALAARGLDVVGADASEQMLALAAAKTVGLPAGRALFLLQDMTCLDLYGTVDTAFCTLDGVNHLLTEQDVAAAFARVSLFLEPGGCFIFDVNTAYKFEHVLDGNAFVYDFDEVYCVWQSAYDRAGGVCDFGLTFFEPSGRLWRRTEERFAERAYSDAALTRLLRQAGLAPLAAYADFTFDAPEETTARVVYVARKEG